MLCRARKKSRKAQGLPMNVIIIAAIVLIVLVVLWAIFTGRMGIFSKSLTEITSMCGIANVRECCSATTNIVSPPGGGKWTDCPTDKPNCCESSYLSTIGDGPDSFRDDAQGITGVTLTG